MSRRRVTGMRIPTTDRSTRTRRDRWTHLCLLGSVALGIVVVVAAGEPAFAVLFALIGVAYIAGDLHS